MGFALPDLSYPFATPASPYAADVDGECFDWGGRMGIFHLGDPEEYRRTRVGWLAGYTAPGSTRAGLRLLADWQMWLFAFDDGYCDESERGLRPDAMVRRTVALLRVLEGARPDPTDPFGVALGDIVRRVSLAAQGFQLARFVAAVTWYLAAQCWEAVNRAAGTPPALPEYLVMRRYGSAVPTCTALIDVAGGFEVPERDYHDPAVVALTTMAVNVACWANDVTSYPKEVRRSSTVHSLPVVLARRFGAEPEAMLGRVARMHDREVFRYLTLEHRVRATASGPLRRYLDGLRAWMAGNLRWSRQTARYRVENP